MPSRTAQPTRKPAKKTSKRVVLYVPDTFDPDVHLPEELRHLADYARFLLHRINVGRVHLRRGNCLVYLKHDYLAKFMPRGMLTIIRDALEEAGVIHVRKFCVPGELCYGYRLCPPHNQGFSHYQPTTKQAREQDHGVASQGVQRPPSPPPSGSAPFCQSDHD